jgi:hypothetical protein
MQVRIQTDPGRGLNIACLRWFSVIGGVEFHAALRSRAPATIANIKRCSRAEYIGDRIEV